MSATSQALASRSFCERAAAEVVRTNFRGCVLGQQGLYIDKIALEAGARDFDLEQLIENANALHEHVKKHGEVKF